MKMTTQEIRPEWYGKPYYSLDAWCKNTLGRKCYKIALNAHMTCPNRDGSLDTRGCIFCSAGGSGDFAADITEWISHISAADADPDQSSRRSLSPNLIAYFQAYTNTYAPVPYLRQIYSEALSRSDVCGISIATRPDCLPDEVLSLLAELKTAFPNKFIWVELGLQTIHEQTARFIRRGYELPCFEKAFRKLQEINIPVIVHLILGLPGETPDMLRESITYMNKLRPFGIKLQLLHILSGTDLGDMYLRGEVHPLEKDEYLYLLIDCIRRLSPDIVIHRLTGDGPKSILLAPKWSANKRDVLNSLHKRLKLLSAHQGDHVKTATHKPASSKASRK